MFLTLTLSPLSTEHLTKLKKMKPKNKKQRRKKRKKRSRLHQWWRNHRRHPLYVHRTREEGNVVLRPSVKDGGVHGSEKVILMTPKFSCYIVDLASESLTFFKNP
ncbi:hypothetical protein YC2023_002574 [Brassica napus]